MNKHSSFPSGDSLLEKVAELYQLRAGMQRLPVAAEVEAEARLPGATHAAVEVKAEAPRRAPSGKSTVDRALLAQNILLDSDGPASGLAEEFRIVKRQLLLAASGRTGIADSIRQTILVCSAQPNEGKTFAAMNLALSIAAEKDLEVLLVDGDFANPQIPGLLGLEPGPGLIDAVADQECDPEALVVRTDVPGLSVLPAGRPAKNITELLASARTREVFRALSQGHARRVLVLDSPPALVASPATVLAAHAGQIMMVVGADRTTETDLREALQLLSACEHISLVLNRARLHVGGRRFGTYYGYGND